MPRERIDIPFELHWLSILDETGSLDEDLEPDLSEDLLLRMYDEMLLARRFDDRMLSLQKQGRIGTFAPVRGQEASQIGSVATLGPRDWIVPSYREIAVAVWLGLPLDGMLLYNAGFNEGGAVPSDQNLLPNAVPVGSQMLHAVGIAYALRQRGRKREWKREKREEEQERDDDGPEDDEAIVMTYFGDGATSEGDFHEAMNFAGVFDCPCVFLCQNNQYAISVPREQQSRSRTLAQKAWAYGLPCIQVDGNDVLAVHVATQEAVERAREEHRATLIECVTYRLGVHTTVDDPSKYRESEEVETWSERDPLPRFQQYLVDRGLVDDKRIGQAEGRAEEAIRAALESWEERMKSAAGPSIMFDHVYAEPTRDLEREREAFEAGWPEREAAARRASGESGDDAEDGTEDAAGDESNEDTEEEADVG